MAKRQGKQNKDLLTRIRDRYKTMTEADETNRRLAMEDMKFVNEPGAQWDDFLRRERGERPCYEFNKLRITVKRVINDMRANRPAGKVRAVEDSDKDTADIYEGLIRNIANNSDFDTVMDTAAEYQVTAGIGAWRVTTKYIDDDSFDQDIVIEAIPNPFCLYVDPSAKDQLHRDAQDWILTERIAKASYEKRWPKADVIDFESTEFDDDLEWEDEQTVRICEYWYKEPHTKELWQLVDGRVVDAEVDGASIDPAQIARKKRVNGTKIMMCIASGEAILEGPTEWAGNKFPFVLVYGERMVIDGKVKWFGLPRFSKDAQRGYNVERTSAIEAVALSPNHKWWATAEQALGHTDKWAEAHKKNFPFMLYNADPKVPGPPQMAGPPAVPQALMALMQFSSDDIKATSGIFDNSLGQEGNETSGKAIVARQRQGEIATFNYQDNMGKGVRLTWEICVDLAKRVYDTQRQLRILGPDGAEKYKTVNEVKIDPSTGQQITVNDLSKGRFDVTVTVGPSFATQRQEAAEAYTELASRDPNVMMAAGDLVFKALDLPYAQEIAERYKALLPPPIQAMLQDGQQSPEVAQAMAQVQQAMAMVDEKGKLVQAAEQELKELEAQAKGDVANAKLAKADLEARAREIEIAQEEVERAAQMLEDAKQQALAEIAHAQEVLKLNERIAQLQIEKAHVSAQESLKDQAHQQDVREAKASAEQPA